MNINTNNRNMINSNTQYHEDDSSSDDLDSRIARYANIKGKPIGDFTDSDSSSDNKNEQNDENESDSNESSDEEEVESQTESFNVSVRVRPLFSKEKMLKYKNIIRVAQEKYVVLKNPEVANKNDYLAMKRDRQKRFQFDNVFDNKVSTDIVYKKTVRRLIKSILEGYNGTVFAYGATGSGKTYTMLGSDTEPGVMIHTLRDLFKLKEKQSDKYTFRIVISFLEIYNENIRDLLVKSSHKKKKKYLDLRETPQKGVIIAGITFKPAENVSTVMDLLNLGNKRRTTESTAANSVSSRSHAVLQIYVERKSKDLSDRDIRCGKLNLIDLAGSEKGSVVKSGNKSGMREGANINKSLLALSKCINSLVDKKKFIPYRDSKLTRLLQDALGGNCKTIMICNISPSSNTWDDTHNTLKYADRAKNIRIKKAEINKMKNENKNDLNIVINDLKSQVELLQKSLVKTKQEKKTWKRKSKLMVTQQQQQSGNSLGLLSEQDMQLLSLARDKLKNKMLNLDNLHLKLKHLNDEENNLLQQEISMKSMLKYGNDNNFELENKYRNIVNKISSIKLQKMEVEREIQFIVSNTNSEVNTLVKSHSNSSHLHGMIDKENELFLATINKKSTELNMSFMQNKYMNQEAQMKKIAEENKQKNDILLQQNAEFESIKRQLTQLKLSRETQENEKKDQEMEMQKQLTFYKKKYEEDMKLEIEKQAKENELRLQKEMEELKEMKRKQLEMLEQQKVENNKPKRKDNISPMDFPYNKWDKSDVYFYLVDELNIDEKYAILIYEQELDGDSIIDIKEHDLKEIGINAMGVRKKIVKNIDLLDQTLNSINMSQSTLATSVAWNSMYKGGNELMNHRNSNLSMVESVFSDMTSVSQVEAKKQMRLMQEQLKSNPSNAENPQFMIQMMHVFASSQQLIPQINSPIGNNVNVPQALPEDKEIVAINDDVLNNTLEMEEKEEKSKLPLMETNRDNAKGEMESDDEDVKLLKEKQKEAKKAVNELAHRIKQSMTGQQMKNITNVLLPTDKFVNELDDLGDNLTPGYADDEYDIEFNNDNNNDSDDDKPYDYDETWMHNNKINSFNIVLLSPYKSLRKAFLKFCFEPQIIANRKRTMSYKRYEKQMKCGDKEFIFRILECYESNYIPDLFDAGLVELIIMLFPIDIFSTEINTKEKEFMDDLDTWLHSSTHWDRFWNKTIPLLDKSLSFKKNIFDSMEDYFNGNNNRINNLNELFSTFNVPNINRLKWINIDTNKKSKLKLRDITFNNKKYKYKYPHIPIYNNNYNGIYEKEDWRLTLTLKVFDYLTEPNTSYFLTCALFSPEKNLCAPTYEMTAQSAYKYGPFSAQNNNDIQLEIEENPKPKPKPEIIQNDIINEAPPKLSDSPPIRATSVELAQAETDAVPDTAAVLDDDYQTVIAVSDEPLVPSVPSAPVFDDNEPSDDNNDEELEKQLMQEAFAKFEQKKQQHEMAQEDEEDIELEDEYMISGPPNQRDGNPNYIYDQVVTVNIEDMAMTMDDDDEGGGAVTPTDIENDFMISPSPFANVFESKNGNSKPIINDRQNNNSNVLSIVKGNENGNRRVSKAYHGYQPSWATLKTNKLHNTWSFYGNNNNNIYTTPYGGNTPYGDDSDDEEIDDELDFAKAKYSQENTFSRKYVNANRNQSIMRYQDILDNSNAAANDLKQEQMDDICQDINASFLEIDDLSIIQTRRGSKYTKNNNNIQQRKSSYNENNNNYSSPVDRTQSVTSQHSYSGQRKFGARDKNKNKKKGNMWKKMLAWGN